jgi:hypothetical protein
MGCRGCLKAIWLVAILCAAPALAVGGPYADEMGKCLVDKTSPADRTTLARWIFGLLSMHPDVGSLASISAQQRAALNKDMGALIERLLLESCRSETRAAWQNEGPHTVEYAFQILGQVAMRGLLMDPHVAEGIKDLGTVVDEKKLEAMMAEPGGQK